MNTKTFYFSCLVILSSLFTLSCSGESPTPTPAPTRIPTNPMVISNSPDVVVNTWEYFDPRDENKRVPFHIRGPNTYSFGPSYHDASIAWYGNRFGLLWISYMCSVQPILVIDEGTINVWINEGIFENCDSMAVPHAFEVVLETNIPPENWTYAIHRYAPQPSSLER